MEQAASQASQVSPYQQKLDDYNSKLFDLYTGKEKFDLSKLPNIGVLMNNYQGAKASSDAGRIGKGLAYGGGRGTDGYNANLIASIDAQNHAERERDAAGQLEGAVSSTLAGAVPGMMSSADADTALKEQNFKNYAGMYGMQLNAPQKPKWWESLLGGVAGGLSVGSKGWAI